MVRMTSSVSPRLGQSASIHQGGQGAGLARPDALRPGAGIRAHELPDDRDRQDQHQLDQGLIVHLRQIDLHA
jgi:hypothetical protein